MADNELIQQKWINTPFAFTRFNKNLSLLQQAVLVKVSERLQPFIEEFFGSDLCKSKKRPKALFSEAAKNSGITQFNISYAELGVAVNNFYAAKKAVKEVLDLKVSAPGVDENGKQTMIMYNVFSYSEMSLEGHDRVVFSLNADMVDYVFDMTQKYVSHPDNIAFIGEVERMPMIYYLLRRYTANRWEPRELKLTVTDIKEYLGMIEYANGTVIKEAYPKFSQFKKNVLDTSIEDINRLKREGLLDVCISYEPVYIGKRKVGTPAYIRFNIYDTIEDMEKDNACEPVQTEFPFTSSGEEEWKRVVDSYDGPLSDLVSGFSVYAYEDGMLTLSGARVLIELLSERLNGAEAVGFNDAINKAYGRAVALRFRVKDIVQ